MPVQATFEIQNAKEFAASIARAKAQAADLTGPLKLIAKDFHRSQKAVFQSSNFADLSESYKKQKRKDVGFVYPILKRSGALERSTTGESDPNAVVNIDNRDTLFIGSRLSYAGFIDRGTRKMPARPLFQIDDLRLARWVKILNDHVLEQLAKEVG